jgi:tripartite-type tricarboxylate transporter receptor subunit TctC
MVQGSTLWLLPFLRKNASWDTLRDFAPVSWLTRSPNLLLTHPSLPVKSVKTLIDFAKARPGELTYGSSGTGSSTHLAAALFMAMAHINTVHVPYKGAGPALNGLIGGQVHLGFAFAGGAMPHVSAGRLRALAVCSAAPTPLAPGLPTIAETLPGYELVSTLGVVAPAGTPAAIVTRLNQGIVAVLNRPEVKTRFLNAGAETIGSTPDAFTALIRADMGRLGKVIRDAGIRDD